MTNAEALAQERIVIGGIETDADCGVTWRLNETTEDKAGLHGRVFRLAVGGKILVLEGAPRWEEEDAHFDRMWLSLCHAHCALLSRRDLTCFRFWVLVRDVCKMMNEIRFSEEVSASAMNHTVGYFDSCPELGARASTREHVLQRQ